MLGWIREWAAGLCSQRRRVAPRIEPVLSTDDHYSDRTERIAEIRRQIAEGTYDTPQRLEAAVEGFLDSDDAREEADSVRRSPPLRGPHRPR